MSQVTLNSLSADDRKRLMEEALQEEENKKSKVKEERQAYKAMVNETLPNLFFELLGASEALSEMKTMVFQELKALIEMKAQVFGKEGGQYSHSFTTTDGITIIIGSRINDSWDDTVTAGLDKLNKFLDNLGDGENSKLLLKSVRHLLSNNNKENLKASRVLQLKRIADETGNKEFMDAISIIQSAYRPIKSKEFVTCRYKDNNGETVDLALDMSSAEFTFQMPAAYVKPKPKDAQATEA